MRITLIASVVPEYRLPALREWAGLPGVSLSVLATKGGPWATARNSPSAADAVPEISVLEVSVFRLGGAAIVRFLGLRDAIRVRRPDVVVAEPRMGLVSVAGLALWPVRVDGNRVPVVWWMAGWRNASRPQWMVLLSEAMLRVMLRRGAAVAAYSTAAAERAAALGIPAERVIVAQNAVDTSPIAEAVSRCSCRDFDGALRILFIGQVLERKRLDVVLQALGSGGIGCSRARLRVVGAGEDVGRLMELAESLGLASRVEWVEPTYEVDSLAGHLCWADVGVLPAAGGLMINTCMAAALPVAVGQADGTERDLVVPEHTGWVLDADPGIYAGWIEECSRDGSRLRRMGEAARRHLEGVASLGNMVERLTLACRLAKERQT